MSNPDDKLTNYLTTESINWKFIPPRSPNFGGLWESGVKSFKYHLKRAVGSVKLTFEEFLTLTAEIEGILNSRPIVPLSTDPHDYTALTPGHFLIGRPITSIAEPQLIEKSDNYLSRWQKITKLLQQVWKNWKRDYLNNLHLRNKWQFAKNNVSPNDMVILKESDLPPYKWRLGRIQEIIKGSDGYLRPCANNKSTPIQRRKINHIIKTKRGPSYLIQSSPNSTISNWRYDHLPCGATLDKYSRLLNLSLSDIIQIYIPESLEDHHNFVIRTDELEFQQRVLDPGVIKRLYYEYRSSLHSDVVILATDASKNATGVAVAAVNCSLPTELLQSTKFSLVKPLPWSLQFLIM
ncbi:hypothetical protein AVEN_92401-1 [Araneus ventricosus]|uniref:DUF5641 domain-containing protein n=1 Tax=Araneus ventricosus TaxID=182803 RepID=A0A4Y2AHS2_ARAVE|nr:hypothetical protein AVEN_92401-1 [Araneus ventricosus]